VCKKCIFRRMNARWRLSVVTLDFAAGDLGGIGVNHEHQRRMSLGFNILGTTRTDGAFRDTVSVCDGGSCERMENHEHGAQV